MSCQHWAIDRDRAQADHICLHSFCTVIVFTPCHKQLHKALACAPTCALCHCCADACLNDCCSSPPTGHSRLDAHVSAPNQMHLRSIQSLEVSTPALHTVRQQKAQPVTTAAIAVMELPSPAAVLAAMMALGASEAVAAAAGKAALWTLLSSLHQLTFQLR